MNVNSIFNGTYCSFDPWTRTADVQLHWGELVVASFNRDPKNRAQALRKYGPFDPSLAGRPDIWRNPESDKPELLDGGGRWWKAVSEGYAERVHGFVLHETQDRMTARHLCLLLNRQRMTFSKSAEFLAALREGDDIPVAINEMVTSLNLGYVLNERSSGYKAGGQLRCPTFLVPAYHYGVLEPVLTASSAFGLGSGIATNANVLFALGFVFLHNEDSPPDMDRMKEILASMGSFDNIKRNARKSAPSLPLRSGLANLIVHTYNDGIRASGLRQLRYPSEKSIKEFTALD